MNLIRLKLWLREEVIDKAQFFKDLRKSIKIPKLSLFMMGQDRLLKKIALSKALVAAEKFGASCVAVPVKDTIKYSDSEGFINQTLDRSILWSIQTPQTFKYELILEAIKKLQKTAFLGTDDAVLVERLGYKIKLVSGNYYNIKITTKEDVAIAEAIVLIKINLDFKYENIGYYFRYILRIFQISFWHTI